jgi:hypothetical protein
MLDLDQLDVGVGQVLPLQVGLTQILTRVDGVRILSADTVERVVMLGLALEQMRQNLKDLERCAKEWSGEPGSAKGIL